MHPQLKKQYIDSTLEVIKGAKENLAVLREQDEDMREVFLSIVKTGEEFIKSVEARG